MTFLSLFASARPISRAKWNLGVAAILGVAAVSPMLPLGAGVARAAGSQAFSATGADQTFTVPTGVSEIQVYVRGAGGGSVGNTPGKGAYVRAVLSVTPGDVLNIRVGSQGASALYSASFGGGGAAGGTVGWVAQGGGASDIRFGGTALSNRIVVAGGGGASGSQGNGGDAGTPNASDGLPATATESYAGQGGGGATQSAGGRSGAGRSDCGNAAGAAGVLGEGGTGGRAHWGNYWYGSGGGGGYYGGGGGGSGCNSGAGGGGSSWVNSSWSSNFSYALATSVTAGCIEIAWPAGTAASTCLGAAAPTTTTIATTTTTTTSTTTTTTTLPPTTTSTTTTSTTAAPTTTAAPSTTIAGTTTTVVGTTTTVAGSTSQSSASTVAPVNTASAPVNTASAPVTTVKPTTTTTATTTTVPADQRIDAPDAVDVEPGVAAALVNGQSVEMTLSRANNTVSIEGAGISGSISLMDSSGQIVPLDTEGNLHVNGDATAVVEFDGAKPGSILELWVFSDPQQLVKTKVAKNGEVRLQVPMPKDLPAGDHKFVATLTNYANSEMSVSLGFVAGDKGSGVSVSGVIFAVLGFGIFFALAIPARRRFRKTADEL